MLYIFEGINELVEIIYKQRTEMGLFLNMSILNISETEIEDELLNFISSRKGDFFLEYNFYDLKVSRINNQFSTILYPTFYTKVFEFTSNLSLELQTKIITISIHDEDYWYFHLFNNGIELTKYSSDQKWDLNENILASEFNIKLDSVNNFFKSIKKESSIFCIEDVSKFLNLLKIPSLNVLKFEDYTKVEIEKNLVSSSNELTVDDLRNSKGYEYCPIELSKEDAENLLEQEIDVDRAVDFHNEVYGTKYQKNYKAKYFLNVDSLTIQIKIKFPDNIDYETITGIGFLNQMSKVYNYLNNFS